MGYDAFHLVDTLLTQPLQVVARLADFYREYL